MNIIKILVSGPLGAGKTTFISTFCHTCILTDRRVTSNRERRYKEKTTVAFDFGIAYFQGIKLYLYGTPGQQRFFYFIPILIKRCDYLLYLIDSSSPASLYRAKLLFEKFFVEKLSSFKNYLVAANKRDLPNVVPIDKIIRVMGISENRIIELIAKNKNSCKEAISKLICHEYLVKESHIQDT